MHMSERRKQTDLQEIASLYGIKSRKIDGNDVEIVLKSLKEASPNFKGIRTFDTDFNNQFLEGFKLLEKYQLTYDNYSPDYNRPPKLAQLAESNPEVKIIVNHLGGRIFPDDQKAW